jgi:hypothetical protein
MKKKRRGDLGGTCAAMEGKEGMGKIIRLVEHRRRPLWARACTCRVTLRCGTCQAWLALFRRVEARRLALRRAAA